jgi:hypothetical protein
VIACRICRTLSGYLGVIARRRLSIEKPVGTEVRQKPGPLQTIFELPPDEVYSIAFFSFVKKFLFCRHSWCGKKLEILHLIIGSCVNDGGCA